MKPEQARQPEPGRNHTGTSVHPEYVAQMLEGTAEFGPTSGGGPDALAENRIRVAAMSAAMATMPAAPQLPLEKLQLLDKLGARLQFERMGTRLYEALISKLDAYGTFTGGPTRAELKEIRNQEHAHMGLAQQLITRLGGDPTVVTPSANLQAIASRGIGDLLVDPRTTLIECLGAMLVAEMTDHHSWTALADLAARSEPAIEAELRRAEQIEATHLERVRGWLAAVSELRTGRH